MVYRFVMLFTFILLFSTAEARVFRNAYIAFELPETWKCNLEQTEWVCRSEAGKESKEAIIILTAKEVGPTDSFQQYEAHLNSPIPAPSRTGAQTESKVVYKTKTVQINDHQWIDGLHLASEVGNYYTRYLATIKDKIAILVTFSAHKDFYTKYSQDFFKAVMSLRVIASKNLLARPDLGPVRPGTETLGQSIGAAMPADLNSEEGTPKSANGRNLLLIIAIALAAAGVFVLIKARRK